MPSSKKQQSSSRHRSSLIALALTLLAPLLALTIISITTTTTSTSTTSTTSSTSSNTLQKHMTNEPMSAAIVPWKQVGSDAIGGQFVLLERLALIANVPNADGAALEHYRSGGGGEQHVYDYELRGQFGRGGFGEVWAAVRVPVPHRTGSEHPHLAHYHLAGGDVSGFSVVDEDAVFVLKRFIAGEERRLSALREVHFGTLLRGVEHVSRFLEYFEEDQEQWLVFRHEGISLRQWLYGSTSGGYLQRNQRSVRWAKMKSEGESTGFGFTQMQSIIYQLLLALNECHSRNITHRDVKPSNILLKKLPGRGRTVLDRKSTPPGDYYVTLGDFGSAVDDISMGDTYPFFGPTKNEETLEYAPPEVLFSQAPFALNARTSYDMWSLGVVMLELIFGSSDVFRIADRTKVILEPHLRREHTSKELRLLAFTFRAFYEYCIYRPSLHGRVYIPPQLSSEQACSDVDLHALLSSYDPMRIGPPSKWALKLIRRLLQWDPRARISASEALQHAWFHGPYTCPVCAAQFELPTHLQRHSCTDDLDLSPLSDTAA